jgi:hypothetical protein
MCIRVLRNQFFSIITAEDAREEIELDNDDIYSITCYISKKGYFGFTPTRLTRGPTGTNGQTIYAELVDPKWLDYTPLELLSEQDFPYFATKKSNKKPLVKSISKVSSNEDNMLRLTALIKLTIQKRADLYTEINDRQEEVEALLDCIDANIVLAEDYDIVIEGYLEELLNCKK